MIIELTEGMKSSLRSFICAHALHASNPDRAREEARSYAAELAYALVVAIGGEVTHEQHVAHLTNSGPSAATIQRANALAKLDEVTHG